MCVCVTNTVLHGKPGLQTYSVSQGAENDSEINDNELAESEVQNIRDEPELNSTAVETKVCVCIIASTRSGNISIWAQHREEHPLR